MPAFVCLFVFVVGVPCGFTGLSIAALLSPPSLPNPPTPPLPQGWDGANCAPCCGTNVIFSRACLTSIGGFIYGSVTEDFLTSMYLHNAG